MLRYTFSHGSFIKALVVLLICLSASVKAALHHECFVFGERSEGAITVRNDWNWRSSAFFYESQNVWKTDIPIFITEDYFLAPNWGQKFGKCTVDLYSVGLCSKDELFVSHDLLTGNFIKADDNNKFILARRNCTYRVQTNDPTVVCVMMFQNPNFGAKERRVEITANNTFDSTSLNSSDVLSPFNIQALAIAVLGLSILQVIARNRNADSVLSSYTIASSNLVGFKLIQLSCQKLLSWTVSYQDRSSLVPRLMLADDSALSLLASDVVLLLTLLNMVIHISKDTKTDLSNADTSRCRTILFITSIIKVVTSLLPLPTTMLIVAGGFVKVSLAWASLSVWFCAHAVLKKMEHPDAPSTTRYTLQSTVTIIVYSVICLRLLDPLYRIVLINHYAILPDKIHLHDWLRLDELFTRVVPVPYLTSLTTGVIIHSTTITPLVIAGVLRFWSSSKSRDQASRPAPTMVLPIFCRP